MADSRRANRLFRSAVGAPWGVEGLESAELKPEWADPHLLVNITFIIRTKPYTSKNRPVETPRIRFLAAAPLNGEPARLRFPTLDLLALS
jgi:hypothetical protein